MDYGLRPSYSADKGYRVTPFSWPVYSCIAICGALAFLLIRRGLRGTPIHDHPLCAKCRYDLTGRPNESTRCPECGADLEKPKAVRIGARKRRLRPLLVGSSLLLLTAAFSIVTITGVLRGVNWYEHKPVWWLLYDAKRGNPASAPPSIFELHRRMNAGEMDNESRDHVLQTALAFQADSSKPWFSEWGEMIESAYDKGLLNEADWLRYARQGVSAGLKIRVREFTMIGRPVPLSVSTSTDRLCRQTRIWAHIDFEPEARLGGAVLNFPRRLPSHEFPRYRELGARHRFATFVRIEDVESLSEGPGAVQYQVHVGLVDSANAYHVPEDAEPFAEWDANLESTTNLCHESRNIELSNDPSLRPDIDVTLVQSGPEGDPEHRLVLKPKPTSGPIACDVVLRSNESELVLFERVLLEHPKYGGHSWTYVLSAEVRESPITILLRPSPEAAEGSLAVEKIWGQTIEFANIRVVVE